MWKQRSRDVSSLFYERLLPSTLLINSAIAMDFEWSPMPRYESSQWTFRTEAVRIRANVPKLDWTGLPFEPWYVTSWTRSETGLGWFFTSTLIGAHCSALTTNDLDLHNPSSNWLRDKNTYTHTCACAETDQSESSLQLEKDSSRGFTQKTHHESFGGELQRSIQPGCVLHQCTIFINRNQPRSTWTLLRYFDCMGALCKRMRNN